MKTSLIATVLNEEKNLELFISSILAQTKKADEIIIVDGHSEDNSFEILEKYKKSIRLLRKKGNRSTGRNLAIEKAKGDIILITDAGCILKNNWVEEISRSFRQKHVDVVAGYYKGKANTIFQKCLIPYVLVMPDKVDPKNFLPATRSMGLRKRVWKEVGGFDERFSNNEDYVFARSVKKTGAKIVFNFRAIVYWIPRENLSQSFNMFYRFAMGDAEAGILRPKVTLIFLRLVFGALLVFMFFYESNVMYVYFLLSLIFLYSAWSVLKNYKYVSHYKAVFYLPLIQIVSDFAVFFGTLSGFISRTKFLL